MMMRSALLAALCAAATAQTISLHGSGTTNPKKVHWQLMSEMEEMSGQPVELSYRAIGSSSGKVEFLAKTSAFGCAEIPVLEAEKVAGETVLQLPLVLGAMSVFHSIPTADVGTAGLELTPCMLGQIFSRQITTWSDDRLREGGVNQGLETVNEAITVYHRDKGSSTTNFFTKYLHESTRADCPTAWDIGWGPALTDADDVTKYPLVTGMWAAGTVTVQGSGGMSSDIQANPYAIGYIDSGHGHDDGLKEVKLKNLDGYFVDSVTAGQAGVMAAATAATMPAADGNWEGVNLINQAGATTWPIVAISYLLVHQDQTANGATGNLLKAYLTMTMDNTIGGQAIASNYNFIPITEAMRTVNTNAIASITTATPSPAFVFEKSTDTTIGPAATTFSVKRQTHEMRLLEKHEAELELITGSSGSLTAIAAKLKEGHDTSIPLEMHGSGTTNPSKMMWKMMAALKGMAIRPLHMSYRAIGSSSGIAEFKAGSSHFGSAEIPLTEQDKVEISGDVNAPADVLQLPLVLGAMSAFHSLPAEYLNGADGLHLTPCVLAKIFARQITAWDDAEIATLNPTASLPSRGIVMLHRKKGSSTTNFFTKYLHEVTRTDCPTAWTIGWGAKLTESSDIGGTVTGTWAADATPADASGGVITCEGSGQMASNLATVPFSIGYIDAGHGHDDGLSEIKLRNAAGNYIDSKDAGDQGVMAAAAAASFPATSAGDWSTVNLLNVNAQTSLSVSELATFFPDGIDQTWPIVAASYVFVQRDLTSMGETGAAVKAFLEYTMSTEKGYASTKGGQKYAGEFKFTPLPQSLLDVNNAGIASITLASGVTPFQWEWSTDTTIGPQRNTLSCKRSNYDTYALSSLSSTLADLLGTTGGFDSLEEAHIAVENLRTELGGGAAAAPAPAPETNDSEIVAIIALIVAVISLLLNVVMMCGLCGGKTPAGQCATPQERQYANNGNDESADRP